MNKRDTLRKKLAAPRGILHLPQHQQVCGLQRFEPSDPLARFVEHYWEVTWVDEPKIVRETVPFPSVHMTFEASGSRVHGVHKHKFSRTIEGTGRVLGVKFRPGGFRTFLKGSVADLTGMIFEPATVFGDSIFKLEKAVLANSDAEQSFLLVDSYLQQLQPVSNSKLDLIGNIMPRVEADRTIVRAKQIANEFSIGLRSLQRIFQEYVGVSPKWVLQRLRLIETAERMRNGQSDLDFPKLALELGFSDQAHFIRNFKLFFGMTPSEYHRSLRV